MINLSYSKEYNWFGCWHGWMCRLWVKLRNFFLFFCYECYSDFCLIKFPMIDSMTEFVKLIFLFIVPNWTIDLFIFRWFYEDFADILLVTTGVGFVSLQVDNEEYGWITWHLQWGASRAILLFICLISLSYSFIKSITVKNLFIGLYVSRSVWFR